MQGKSARGHASEPSTSAASAQHGSRRGSGGMLLRAMQPHDDAHCSTGGTGGGGCIGTSALWALLTPRRWATVGVVYLVLVVVVLVICQSTRTHWSSWKYISGLLEHGSPFFLSYCRAACHQPLSRTASVTETAALIMRCIAQDGAAAAAPMREGALSEGALLHHLLGALGLVCLFLWWQCFLHGHNAHTCLLLDTCATSIAPCLPCNNRWAPGPQGRA